MSDIENLYTSIKQRVEQDPNTTSQSGLDYPGVEKDVTVVRSLTIKPAPPLEKLVLSITTPDARPAFEWLAEITVDRGGSDYHRYLIRDGYELVGVQRKETWELSPKEQADLIKLIAPLVTA